MIFRKAPKNEKWGTIRKREFRNDVVFGIIAVPAMYVFAVCMCALGV